MSRSDMSDLEWQFVNCVLPNKSRGVKRVDDRRVINGIFFALRVGCAILDYNVRQRSGLGRVGREKNQILFFLIGVCLLPFFESSQPRFLKE